MSNDDEIPHYVRNDLIIRQMKKEGENWRRSRQFSPSFFSCAIARHSDRREESPQKYVLCAEGKAQKKPPINEQFFSIFNFQFFTTFSVNTPLSVFIRRKYIPLDKDEISTSPDLSEGVEV